MRMRGRRRRKVEKEDEESEQEEKKDEDKKEEKRKEDDSDSRNALGAAETTRQLILTVLVTATGCTTACQASAVEHVREGI
jgi:hypothetical protein